jgi:hypothetical protein
MPLTQVLVVQENSGVLKGKGVWKMPTGLVHAGGQEAVSVSLFAHSVTCSWDTVAAAHVLSTGVVGQMMLLTKDV